MPIFVPDVQSYCVYSSNRQHSLHPDLYPDIFCKPNLDHWNILQATEEVWVPCGACVPLYKILTAPLCVFQPARVSKTILLTDELPAYAILNFRYGRIDFGFYSIFRAFFCDNHTDQGQHDPQRHKYKYDVCQTSVYSIANFYLTVDYLFAFNALLKIV